MENFVFPFSPPPSTKKFEFHIKDCKREKRKENSLLQGKNCYVFPQRDFPFLAKIRRRKCVFLFLSHEGKSRDERSVDCCASGKKKSQQSESTFSITES